MLVEKVRFYCVIYRFTIVYAIVQSEALAEPSRTCTLDPWYIQAALKRCHQVLPGPKVTS